MSGISCISTATSVTQSMPGSGTTATPAAMSARWLTRRRQWRTTASISRVVAGTTAQSDGRPWPREELAQCRVRHHVVACVPRFVSGERLRPDFVEPLDAHRLRRLQLLREEARRAAPRATSGILEARVARAASARRAAAGSAAPAAAARPARARRAPGRRAACRAARRSPSGSAADAAAAPTACRR